MSAFDDARTLFRSGRKEEALERFREALGRQGGHAGAWAEYSTLLLASGRFDEAENASGRALDLDARNLPARLVGIQTRTLLGRLEEAERFGQESLAVHPDSVDLRLAVADSRIRRGDLMGARALLEEAGRRAPDHKGVRNMLGEVLLKLGDWDRIREDLERQLEGVEGPQADLERAGVDLRFGFMPQGWERYEARWQLADFADREQHYPQPRWNGEPFPGRTLLLFWEQGFGDTFMFVRYVALAKARGGRVILAAQAQLAEVVATCPGVDEIVPHGQPLPPFDLQAPLLSLPWIFRTTLSSIPAEVPYLSVPPSVPHRREIDEMLRTSGDGLRIGLVWAGSSGFRNDARRSLTARQLEPLAALPEVAWFSFQVGRSEILPFPGIRSLEPLLGSFADTAHALSAMDLLITTDSAVAHLAGAMGIPVFLLLSALPDWRWMMGRSDSPWYPTLRIYRQPSPGDWAGAIEQMLQDLAGGD